MDYYFISYPKSGRTWIQLLISKYLSYVSDVECIDLLKSNKISFGNGHSIFFSHGRSNGSICQGRKIDFYRDKEIILLTRNVADVMISYYHYAKYSLHTHDGSFEIFVRKLPFDRDQSSDESRHGLMAYVNYHKFFLNLNHIGFYLNYSLVKQNVVTNFTNLLCYLGIEIYPDYLSDTIEFCSRRNMKLLENNNILEWYGLNGNGLGAKVRTDSVMSRNEISLELVELIENNMKSNFTESDLCLLDFTSS
ncbi:MAG: sulfotransferase domain-containing protein [Cyclobacteriaceae bacterium]